MLAVYQPDAAPCRSTHILFIHHPQPFTSVSPLLCYQHSSTPVTTSPYPGQDPPSTTVLCRTLLNFTSTQELENAATAVPTLNEEVVDAAPQYKEEVGIIDDDNLSQSPSCN